MNNFKKIVVIFFVLSFFSNGKTILADHNDFSVTPVLPENQNVEVQNYFDLVVIPNQNQILKVKIRNNSENNQKYRLYVNTATTNQNGFVDYSLTDFIKDESMKISLKDCINLSKSQIEVPKNSEKEFSLELSVPDVEFNGILLGAITVEPVTAEMNSGINNLFTRTVAIQLSQNDSPVSGNLKAGEVTISQDNYRNNIKISLRNVAPVIINKVKVEVVITKKDGIKPILKDKREQLSFAPNSKFNFMSELGNQFEPGEYNYFIRINDEYGEKWSFNRKFKINKEESIKFNGTSVNKKENTSNKHYIYDIFLVSSLIFIAFLVLFKMRRGKN